MYKLAAVFYMTLLKRMWCVSAGSQQRLNSNNGLICGHSGLEVNCDPSWQQHLPAQCLRLDLFN